MIIALCLVVKNTYIDRITIKRILNKDLTSKELQAPIKK